MANLYGRLQGSRGEATRMGHSEIYAQVETWEGKVRVDLDADGDFVVTVGEKYGSGQIALKGNVGNDPALGRYIVGPDGRVYTEQKQGFLTRFRPLRMTAKIRELAKTHAL